MNVTKSNFQSFLDKGELFAAMKNGNWWKLRRNGRTQTWKRDANRIRVPIKCGLRSTGAIDETAFDSHGNLHSDCYRHVDDVPAKPQFGHAFR